MSDHLFCSNTLILHVFICSKSACKSRAGAGGTGGGVEDTNERAHYHFDDEKGMEDIEPEEKSPIGVSL